MQTDQTSTSLNESVPSTEERNYLPSNEQFQDFIDKEFEQNFPNKESCFNLNTQNDENLFSPMDKQDRFFFSEEGELNVERFSNFHFNFNSSINDEDYINNSMSSFSVNWFENY